MYSIAERVNDYCKRTGTTRDELARQLGFSRQTLRAKLNGDIDFRVSEAIALADIIGCEVDDFRQTAGVDA